MMRGFRIGPLESDMSPVDENREQDSPMNVFGTATNPKRQPASNSGRRKSRAGDLFSRAVEKFKDKNTRTTYIRKLLFLCMFIFMIVFISWFVYMPGHFTVAGKTCSSIHQGCTDGHSQCKQENGSDCDATLDTCTKAANKEYECSTRARALDGFYFWTTTTSTVGYGDILPATPAAKFVTSVYQGFLILLSMGTFWSFTDSYLSRIAEKASNTAAGVKSAIKDVTKGRFTVSRRSDIQDSS